MGTIAASCLVAGLGGGMAEHGKRSPAPARRPEPSWPAVIATTIRLWVERHPVAGVKMTGWRLLALVAGAVIVISAAITGVAIGTETTSSSAALSRPASSVPRPSASLRVAAATRDAAARWVAGQVSQGAIVACDPAMCAALAASGVAAGRLLILGTATPDPLGSDLVVSTPAVRSQFGARLASVYAPEVIASFGSGAGRIDIRAIAPDGTAAYDSALAEDRGARISAGRQLIDNRRITIPAAARAALRAGHVDPRILTVLAALAALAAQHPLRILTFGDPSPGASAAMPLRGAEIAPARAGTRTAARLRSMLSFLRAQRLPFLPARAVITGQSVLSIAYAAPSPLGLLTGT